MANLAPNFMEIAVGNVKLLASVSFNENKLLTNVARDLHDLLDFG